MKYRFLLIFVVFAGALFAHIPACAAPAAKSGPQVVVPVRDIARGEVIALTDLASVAVGPGVQPGTVMAMRQIVGLETRRALRAGESLRTEDFRHPIVVTKGSIVTMTYDVPGVELTAMMRAIGSGGIGETVSVQNPVSYRVVGAIVTGPGQVRAIGGAGADIGVQADAEPTAKVSRLGR